MARHGNDHAVLVLVRQLRMPGAVAAALLAFGSFLFMWPFARLDFDRHHDGYMLAQAIAVHQGASIHADVFAQYGPVTPWLQSLALFLPMGPGLALRTINVVVIACTIFFLADMGRKRPSDWPVTRAVGWWAAVSWIVLSDVWMGIPMLPWSSTVAAMLSVMTLYFLTRSFWFAEVGYSTRASAMAFAAGVSVGLMPFTRLNVGLSALVVCLIALALIIYVERGARRTRAIIFMGGTLLSFLIVVVILAHANSLADFYYQSIKWPLTWGRNATQDWKTRENLTRIFTIQALPAALVIIVLILQIRTRSVQRGWSPTKSGVMLFTVLVGLVIAFWENWPLTAFAPNSDYIYFFMVLSVIVAVLTCIIVTFKLLSGDKSLEQLVPWFLLGGLALSGLSQIVPTWDPRHVWWGIPVGLLLLFSIVYSTSNLNKLSGNPLTIPLLLVTGMAVLSGSVYWGSQRVEGQPGTVIEGMLVTKIEFNQINQDTEFLRRYLLGYESIVYLVDDGDLSVLDGRYRSADPYFVDWGGFPSVESRTRTRIPVVVQTSTIGEAKIRELAHSIDYEIIARNPRLVVLMPMHSS